MTDINEAARLLGKKGGQSTSEAKQAASRANGSKRTLKPIEEVECTCGVADAYPHTWPITAHDHSCRRYRTWYQRQRRAKAKGEGE